MVGLFTRLKTVKAMLVDQPEAVGEGDELDPQPQETTDAAAPAPPGTASLVAGNGNYEPVAGVSIELYAAISRRLAADGFDQSNAMKIAAAHGVAGAAWEAAVAGWNERIKASSDVATRFNALYMGSV